MFRSSLSRMARFDIEIVSDNVCPWCYVGKQKLEKAVSEYQKRHGDEDTFSTTFMPFYLNPDAPKTGRPLSSKP